MKRKIVVLLTMIMVLSMMLFTGCGTQNSETNQTSSAESSSAVEEENQATTVNLKILKEADESMLKWKCRF